uniref:Alternative protein FAM101B n=1 Tax=Homo sapiens TaxID=9606 RepID=L0R6G5_HUMAN|nr:alternative protein FAM101B [Homo sapiens]
MSWFAAVLFPQSLNQMRQQKDHQNCRKAAAVWDREGGGELSLRGQFVRRKAWKK